MSALRILLAAALAAAINTFTAFPQTAVENTAVIEPDDFDVTSALLKHGIAAADLLGQSKTANTSENDCLPSCETLKWLYGDAAVETRDETAYTEFVDGYWSANQVAVRPCCVFKPSDAEQISVMVLLARLTQCPFAAKSGGHAAMAGASSAPNGIVVSFTNMKGIKLSDDRKVASIQPGNLWGDVYRELAKSDVTVVGGRLYNIGVGGLTTGGGISFFSNQYGWACDNVESYDLVSAAGVIIQASSTQNQDLYWALRGGGNNFGLVVSFNLRTISLPGGRFWAGSRTYTEENFAKAGEAFHNIVINSPTDDKAGLWHSWIYYNNTKISLPMLYYGEPDAGNAAIFDDYNAIPAVADKTGNKVLADFALQGMDDTPAGLHEVYYAISSKADSDFHNWVTDLYFEKATEVSDVPGIVPVLTNQGITIPQLKHMRQNGGNALGLDAGEGPFYIIQISVMWSNEEDSEAVYGWVSDFLKQASDEARKRGLYNEFVYMNYASQYQDVISSYGEENKVRLKTISKKYDPTGVFQKLQPGYFKLDRAPVPDSRYFSF